MATRRRDATGGSGTAGRFGSQMTDHDALLAAIIANRADDTPRLVYADYLENDAYPLQPERGEFIRVQCELARLPSIDQCGHKDDHVKASELRRRERELFRDVGNFLPRD